MKVSLYSLLLLITLLHFPINYGWSQSPQYTVQITSLNNLGEAESRVRLLQSQGKNAYYLKSNVPGQGVRYRVRVGTFTTRALASNYGARLKQEGLVTEYFVTPVAAPVVPQGPTTGAIYGAVFDEKTRKPIEKARVEIIPQGNKIPIIRMTDKGGRFLQGVLPPGEYVVNISAPNHLPAKMTLYVEATKSFPLEPVPFPLSEDKALEAVESLAINKRDARRDGGFGKTDVTTLAVGSVARVRTVDELSLLLPGVALAPQTIGTKAGPGVGPGVGTAGQFSVNGMRGRNNNFMIDGADNNDEDVGVRRQGYLTISPQTVDSVRDFQVITALAPAQFGRNIGGQITVVSKSGTDRFHGSVFGFLNSSQTNARNPFDTTNGNQLTPLLAGNNQAVLLQDWNLNRQVLSEQPFQVRNQSGGKDSYTLGQFGFVFSGPLIPKKTFQFLSFERQVQNAVEENSFAVPTLEQRGLFNSGATGFYRNPLPGGVANPNLQAYSATNQGNAVMSLFPFPNNPGGVYGANTFTQTLPDRGRGMVLSGKLDHHFDFKARPQTLAARYNHTQDWRDLPVTGGALFSSLTPSAQTHNVAVSYDSNLSGSESTRQFFNQFRFTYGRTRLNFGRQAERSSLRSSLAFGNDPYYLNADYLQNLTVPPVVGAPNQGPVILVRTRTNAFTPNAPSYRSTEEITGPLGQVVVSGFSPVGVDVYNFPQQRINNTYQFADTLSSRIGNHNFLFGGDVRRSSLNNDITRNARPRLEFNGGFYLNADGSVGAPFSPLDLLATGRASNFSVALQSNAQRGSRINLLSQQWNFFGHDEWQLRHNLSLSAGLRYEYNTPVNERDRIIENTFSSPLFCNDPTKCYPELGRFVGGRTQIFAPDKNNWGPRVGLAYAPNWFGQGRETTLRLGYGIFFDQILGAIVTQSRNVFPNFLTLNTGNLNGVSTDNSLTSGNPLANPLGVLIDGRNLVVPGSKNLLNLPLDTLVSDLRTLRIGDIEATLPTFQQQMPRAQQYSITIEQRLTPSQVLSVAYVGTRATNLVQFTTPNLGPSRITGVTTIGTAGAEIIASPQLNGRVLLPARPSAQSFAATNILGAIYQFEGSARSQYDSLQVQIRSQFGKQLSFQGAYTFSKSTDNSSDIFDLAGAYALPQNTFRLQNERAVSNFDARHRLAYNVSYSLSAFKPENQLIEWLLSGLEVAALGQFQTGQPFTVNTIYDVNRDGNLTDRLDNLEGLRVTGNRRQPIQLAPGTNIGQMLAASGNDGRIGRNTFRAGNFVQLDFMLGKRIAIGERQSILLRIEIINFPNYANYAIPVRILEAPGFGRAVNTVTSRRRIQFTAKYDF